MSAGKKLLFCGGVLMAGGLLMLVQRKEYKSVAGVEAGYVKDNSAYDPNYELKQFAIVRSDAVLTNVTAKLKLNESWGEKYNRGRRLSGAQVEKMVKSRLHLYFVNNTRFLQICVLDHDLNEAAELANAVAESYCEYENQELPRLAAEHPNPRSPPGFEGAQLLARAVAEPQLVRPNYHLATLLMILGAVPVIAGIITYNYSED